MNAFTTVLVVKRVEENFGQIHQAQKEESQKADGKYRPCSQLGKLKRRKANI
jgi:hypothetical protein